MQNIKTKFIREKSPGSEKILLAFLPFWTPYIPPQGITTLKNFIKKHGYYVKTVDSNMDEGFRRFYNEYFEKLQEYIPKDKRGNYYNIGHDVFYNHMMAHLHKDDGKEFLELVKIIIYQTYYIHLDNRQVARLNDILDEFFVNLKKYILNLLEEERPAVFGATAYYGTLPASLFAFRLVKERFPHVKTVVGGGSFADHLMTDTPNLELFLKKTEHYLDKIFIGQGQILFLKWLRGELDESKRVYTLADIGGQTVDISTDVDIPDLSDLNPQEYIYMAITGSRSCPYKCGFCNVRNFWGKHRVKNVKQTVSQMIELYNRYGNQLFFLYDALLNPFITEFTEELIRSDVSLYFVGYLKACTAACDVKNTMLWRRGGYYRARLGLESGSQRVLDLIGKGITVEQIRGTVTSLAYAGIKTTTYWLIGYPGETEDDFQMTLDMVEDLKNDIWEAECNPFNYFYSGQQREDEWSAKRIPLYPENAAKNLITQTWTLDLEPKREEVYRRMNRFVQHCENLGILNPYSIHEIYKADERWKRLHKNAVPSISELKDVNKYVDELKNVKEYVFAQNLERDEGDFVL